MVENKGCSSMAARYPCGRPLLSFPRPLRLIILGATGSIGQQTLDLVKRNPDQLEVVGLSCHGRVDDLLVTLEQLREIHPEGDQPLVAISESPFLLETEQVQYLYEARLSTEEASSPSSD